MATKHDEGDIEQFIEQVMRSKKYRAMTICRDTIRDLITRELAHRKNKRQAIKAARTKLHEVMAPYLGDPDFDEAKEELVQAFGTCDQNEIRRACAHIMSAHASTRERLPILGDFYRRIFAVTGYPKSIIDVACGLHPLSFPWMDVPLSTRYFAYDLNQSRVDFLTYYFSLQGLCDSARTQDILIKFPTEEADVALILKETPRFERRHYGSSAYLFDALRVRYLVISLPTKNLGGRRNLAAGYRQLLYKILGQRPWPLTEIEFNSELVFIVDKQSGQ